MRNWDKTKEGKKWHSEYIKKWKEKYSQIGYDKKYYQENKKRQQENQRERLKIDKNFHINKSISNQIRNSLVSGKLGRHWETLVGYTLQDLIKHLENQFDDKMNWQNYGKYWHIDHIKPKSLFYFIKPKNKEFQNCWGLKNLRPLERIANLKKGNKYEFSQGRDIETEKSKLLCGIQIRSVRKH